MDDGTERVVVINTGLISPNDIVLDPDQTLMYWCDGGKKVIGKARDLILGRRTLSTTLVMLIWVALIPATRWSCIKQSLLSLLAFIALLYVWAWRISQPSSDETLTLCNCTYLVSEKEITPL